MSADTGPDVQSLAQGVAEALVEALTPILGPQIMPVPLMTKDQVATHLGIKLRSVEYMIERGQLASVKINGVRRIEPKELERFIAAQREQA